MSDLFNKNFEQICTASCDAYVCKKRQESKEYKTLRNEVDKLTDEIESKLAADYKLMRRLEEVINQIASMEWKWTYCRGYHDCMKFLKWSEVL